MDWNKRDNDGWTPLHWALSWGHSNIVDIIVQQPNIDYDVKTEAGSTLAQAAVLGGNVKSVKTLTGEATFDCWNVPNSNGDTPIMTALERNMTDLVEILLRCPRIDIHTMKPEEGTSLVKELLWTCPSLQLRMIHEDSCLSREAGRMAKPTLKGLARDAVVEGLATGNIQERDLTSLVARLGLNITGQFKEQLLVKYVERNF